MIEMTLEQYIVVVVGAFLIGVFTPFMIKLSRGN